MKINTLVLSGASTKLSIFVGILRCLFDHNILNEGLEGIEQIVCCSSSMVICIYLMLGIHVDMIEKICIESNYENIINIDSIHLDDIINTYGLFNHEIVTTLIKNLLKHKINKEDITLQELYEIRPILLTAKCANLSNGCIEYINKDTHPNMLLSKLMKITTAIPLLFKPVIYNDMYYVDGGLTGAYPVEFVTKDYLGFWIRSSKKKITNIVEYISKFVGVTPYNSETMDEVSNIMYSSDIHFSEFKLSKQQKIDLVHTGYNTTLEHIQKYNIYNDLFKTPPDEDTIPSEEVHVQE
jgi:hypothetical protein